MKTYWRHDRRGFRNEYDIGVATSAPSGAGYEAAGFHRITRNDALKGLAYRGDSATASYVAASIDGDPVYCRDAIRFIRGHK